MARQSARRTKDFALTARLGRAVETAFQVVAPIVAGEPAAVGAARAVLLLLALGSRLYRGLAFLALGHVAAPLGALESARARVALLVQSLLFADRVRLAIAV